MKLTHTILVGCGGTGSMLAEPLARLMAYHDSGNKQMLLIDGDKFEEKNAARQLFDLKLVGKNKARVMADRLQSICETKVVPAFIDEEAMLAHLASMDGLLKGTPLVVTAVDNHATRRAIIAALDQLPNENFVCLIPGNELETGRVTIHMRFNGKPIFEHPFDKFPEIKNPEDRIPGGCQKEAPSTPQLISANMGAALVCLEITQAILDGKPFYEEVFFHTRRFRQSGKDGTGGDQMVCEPAKPAVPEAATTKPAIVEPQPAEAKTTVKPAAKAAKIAKKKTVKV